MDLLDLTALALGKQIREGQVTALEAAQAAIRRIREAEPEIHAFVTVDEEGAMAQARKVQAEIEAGRGACGHQGQPLHRRTSDHLQFSNAGAFCTHLHGPGGGSFKAGRSGGAWKDKHG